MQSILQIVKHRLTRPCNWATNSVNFERQQRIICSTVVSYQSTRLIQILHTNIRGELLSFKPAGRKWGVNGLAETALPTKRLFTTQSRHFVVQSLYNIRQPSHLLSRLLFRRQSYFLRILASKESHCQCTVETLHNHLILMHGCAFHAVHDQVFSSLQCTEFCFRCHAGFLFLLFFSPAIGLVRAIHF